MKVAGETFRALAAGAIRSGATTAQVESLLVEKGLDPAAAAAMVEEAARARAEAVRAGNRNMLFGGLWCVGGICVTAASHNAASGGGTWVIAWGAIVFGAIQFFRGLTLSSDR